MSKKYNYDILTAKIIMSILVVGIHVFKNNEFINMPEFLVFQGVSRLSVPCLFVYSAYFFYRKESAFKEKYLSYLSRMGKLMLAWGIITIPYILYSAVYVPHRDRGYSYILILFQNLLSPRVNGFWFLYACMICPAIIYGLKNHKMFLMAFSVSYAVLCVFLTSWSFLMPEDVMNVYAQFSARYVSLFNCTFIGIIYYLMGEYIATRNSEELFLFKHRRVGLIISGILFFAEICIVWNCRKYPDTDCYLSLIPLTYFIVINTIEGRIGKFRCREFWSASTVVVFIMQFSMIYYIQAFNRRIGLKLLDNRWVLFILIICIGYLFTAVLLALYKKTKWKLLRYFY